MKLKRAEKRHQLTTASYARLAAWRRALRGFLRFSEEAAERVGLTGQHYQAMLALRACPDDTRLTIADLAHELLIKHNSAVGLVDRLVEQQLIVREASTTDRRKVELRLSARGRQVLSKLAAVHRREIQRIGPMLEHVVSEIRRSEP